MHIIAHESSTTKKQRPQSLFHEFLLTLRIFPPLNNLISRIKRTLSLGIQSKPRNRSKAPKGQRSLRDRVPFWQATYTYTQQAKMVKCLCMQSSPQCSQGGHFYIYFFSLCILKSEAVKNQSPNLSQVIPRPLYYSKKEKRRGMKEASPDKVKGNGNTAGREVKPSGHTQCFSSPKKCPVDLPIVLNLPPGCHNPCANLQRCEKVQTSIQKKLILQKKKKK